MLLSRCLQGSRHINGAKGLFTSALQALTNQGGWQHEVQAVNQELSQLFGSPPSSDDPLQPQTATPNIGASGTPASAGAKLTHVDSSGLASMVDVSDKRPTARTACASCVVKLGPVAYPLVEQNKVAKGNVLATAQIAGISAAKQTSNLIPLCHNILLSKVDVQLELQPVAHAVRITSKAVTVGPTGVEMEALTAASVAALTVYDMCKAASKEIEICELRLDSKTGGKSADYVRPGST